MRLDIEGKHIMLAPHLMGWIAERLEDLNMPYDDIYEARVTFMQQGRRDVVCIQLVLAEKSLNVTQRGVSPDAAMDAAFRVVQRELHHVRTARRGKTSVGGAQETWQAPVSIAAGGTTRTVPRA